MSDQKKSLLFLIPTLGGGDQAVYGYGHLSDGAGFCTGEKVDPLLSDVRSGHAVPPLRICVLPCAPDDVQAIDGQDTSLRGAVRGGKFLSGYLAWHGSGYHRYDGRKL
jgi:hypothetical protein